MELCFRDLKQKSCSNIAVSQDLCGPTTYKYTHTRTHCVGDKGCLRDVSIQTVKVSIQHQPIRSLLSPNMKALIDVELQALDLVTLLSGNSDRRAGGGARQGKK